MAGSFAWSWFCWGGRCSQELELGPFIPTVIECGLGRQPWDLIQEDLGESRWAALTHWNVLLPGHSPLLIIMQIHSPRSKGVHFLSGRVTGIASATGLSFFSSARFQHLDSSCGGRGKVTALWDPPCWARCTKM